MGSFFNYHPAAGDELTIRVTEVDDSAKVEAEFMVSYSRVLEACESPAVIVDGIQKLSSDTSIYVNDTVVRSGQLWMDTIHKGQPSGAFQSYSIATIWHAVRFGQRLKLKLKLLGGWYYQWLHASNTRYMSIYARIVPAFYFHSVKGFAELSKEQVYSSTGVMRLYRREENDLPHGKVRLPNRFARDVSAAYGSTRRRISILFHNCPKIDICQDDSCTKTQQFLYFYNLKETNIWPLGDKRLSLNNILDSFDTFRFKTVPTGNYSLCKLHSGTLFAGRVEGHVEETVDELRDYFEGLCLTCIHHAKRGSFPEDYWKQPFITNYSEGCEMKHGEPTWYFSWLSRHEDREAWQKKLRESREERRQEQQRHEERT